MTTVASGRCTSAPAPEASAIGRNPTDATNAVVSTGRERAADVGALHLGERVHELLLGPDQPLPHHEQPGRVLGARLVAGPGQAHGLA